MARPLHMERPGVWHNVAARGNERGPIYCDDSNRRHFYEFLGQAVATFGLRLHACVLSD
jgi:hypothetical protein